MRERKALAEAKKKATSQPARPSGIPAPKIRGGGKNQKTERSTKPSVPETTAEKGTTKSRQFVQSTGAKLTPRTTQRLLG